MNSLLPHFPVSAFQFLAHSGEMRLGPMWSPYLFAWLILNPSALTLVCIFSLYVVWKVTDFIETNRALAPGR